MQGEPSAVYKCPGGCGKSWLVKQVSKFICRCIPLDAVPVRSQRSSSGSGLDEVMVLDADTGAGRLGRVVTFAPAGVAAANCNGFTFHNGLHARTISYSLLRTLSGGGLLS